MVAIGGDEVGRLQRSDPGGIDTGGVSSCRAEEILSHLQPIDVLARRRSE